ncbi:MAG: monovalent cation:proton antiporter-2 (CPA2) family protein [Pedobacter sp.]|nr:monovalent cation:proton antiporter-2 (CPA2) family protein [Pedobacter sp.]
MGSLHEIALFLGAALLIVPLFKRFGLAVVIGYLAAGIIIGPDVMGFVSDGRSVLHVAEYGVVMLLFLIGLELEPSRLWVLRKSVFGLGSLQMLGTGALFTGLGIFLGYTPAVSVIAGFGLAMSSTAFVLQLLAEKNQLTSQHGRQAFSILLFQDLAVIPLLAIIPLLSGHKGEGHDLMDLLRIVGVFAALIFSSRTLIRPTFRFIANSGAPELFTGAALFIVLGIASLMEFLGLSMALGAFLAGVLLADSEYRHDLEASIQPFKSLLLGLFFMAVGMTADLDLLAADTLGIISAAVGLMLVKFAILLIIGRLAGNSLLSSLSLGVSLAQGGEFAFVLFTTAAAADSIDTALMERLVLIVTVSMALTPLAFMVLERWLEPRLKPQDNRAFDVIEENDNPVVIAGFGRFGQIVARVLRMHKIGFTALEADARQVDFVRRFGNQVYYGNPAHPELLRAAGVGKAKIFVLAIDDVRDSVRTAEAVHRHYPKVKIFARARDRAHAYQLMDIGVHVINREMYLSSLDLARQVLEGLDFPPERAQQGVNTFRDYDDELMRRQHAIYQDEAKLIESSREAMKELESLFESDQQAAEKQKPDEGPRSVHIDQ